jgi:cytosine/adenosine deaminase-related metal-dependent hydrolase
MTARGPARQTPFYRELFSAIDGLGGMLNAHLHLDRAGTLHQPEPPDGWQSLGAHSHAPLSEKHALIARLHEGPAFNREDIVTRVGSCLDVMVEAGTRRADTFVDVAPDRVKLSALEALLEVKEARRGDIDLRVGAYAPFGFKDSDPARFELLARAAEKADFIGSLPERDDRSFYPSHIGFYEHCRRLLRLSAELRKPLHLHLDQRNDPSERATEVLAEAVAEFGAADFIEDEPMVWAVHAISPSAYDDARFEALVEQLVRNDIGVICCPSAALGMRQLRPLLTPTHNSIARVLEMAAAGVHVRLGSDNIADVFSPSTTSDLTDELYLLSGALRFYDVGLLASFAAGVRLDARSRKTLHRHLQENRAETETMIRQAPLPRV